MVDTAVRDNEPLGRLTIRQRRAMGLTFVGTLRAARELARRGDITSTTDPKEMAAAIAEEIMLTNARAWSDHASSIDWDAILAFIEKLIPLIMKLIALFG